MASILGQALPLFSRLMPKKMGSRGLRYEFDLVTQTTQTVIINLTQQGLELCNGVFIDNSLNANAFTLTNPVTGQIVYCPAYSQASLALITTVSGDNQQFIGASNGGVRVPCVFRNTEPQSDIIWSVLAPGAISGAITVQGTVTSQMYGTAGTDNAGTIVSAATNQQLFASTPTRKGLLISNPATGSSQGLGTNPPESLFICFGAAATLGGPKMIEIVPGGYFQSGTFVDTRSVSAIAASAGHVYTAIQYL